MCFLIEPGTWLSCWGGGVAGLLAPSLLFWVCSFLAFRVGVVGLGGWVGGCGFWFGVALWGLWCGCLALWPWWCSSGLPCTLFKPCLNLTSLICIFDVRSFAHDMYSYNPLLIIAL